MNTKNCRATAFVVEKGLEEARAKNWTLVDMKKDWKIIFPGTK